MDTLDHAAVVAHYRSVAAAVVGHATGRSVVAVDWGGSRPLSLGDEEALVAAADAGARWFGVPLHELESWAAVRISTGEGADTATAATVALALLESAEGAGAITLTDGDQGFLILLRQPAAGARTIGAMIGELAARAPELATLEPGGESGRVLLTPLGGAEPVPLPYSLVESTDGTGVVIPITIDDVAAAAAGMPLEFLPKDAPARLATIADPAAALSSRHGGTA